MPQVTCKNCSYKCTYDCAQLRYTMQHYEADPENLTKLMTMMLLMVVAAHRDCVFTPQKYSYLLTYLIRLTYIVCRKALTRKCGNCDALQLETARRRANPYPL